MFEIINYLVTIVFVLCVKILIWGGELTGLGYTGINVLIFCVIWPCCTLGLVIWLWKVMKERDKQLAINNEQLAMINFLNQEKMPIYRVYSIKGYESFSDVIKVGDTFKWDAGLSIYRSLNWDLPRDFVETHSDIFEEFDGVGV